MPHREGNGVFHTGQSICPQLWLGRHSWHVPETSSPLLNVTGVLNTCEQEK